MPRDIIFFWMYCSGKRFAISSLWKSSMTMIISAHDSCLAVTGFSLKSPADFVLNLPLNSSSAVLLLIWFWLHINNTFISHNFTLKNINFTDLDHWTSAGAGYLKGFCIILVDDNPKLHLSGKGRQ